MKLTKEEAYEITNDYIAKYRLPKNRTDNIDGCVTFCESFDSIEGSAWRIAGNMGIFIVSDKKKQVEYVLDQEGFHITHHIDDHLDLNLTKEKAFEIAENYREKHGFEYEPIEDIDHLVTFYNNFYLLDEDGPAWIVRYKFQYNEGRLAIVDCVVSDKSMQVDYLLDDHGRETTPHLEEEKDWIDDEDLLQELKKVLTSGTEDEQLGFLMFELQPAFYEEKKYFKDIKNTHEFEEIMRILINYAIDHKEGDVVDEALCVILNMQEYQDTKSIDFDALANNLYSVDGEILLLHINILGRTNDPRYIPYLSSLKSHNNVEIRARAEYTLMKLGYKNIDFNAFAESLSVVPYVDLLEYIDILGNTNDSRYIPYLLNLGSQEHHEYFEAKERTKKALAKLGYKAPLE